MILSLPKEILNAKYTKEQILECLYDKTYACPICDISFKERTVRSKKIHLVTTDSDLRPYNAPVDPIYYEVIVCPNCGYAALSRSFENVTLKQQQSISKVIMPKYKQREFPLIYDEDVAIERYKLAYLTSMTKNAKRSELAYLCLKIAWIYRVKGDTDFELKMLDQARVGFIDALQRERFPIMEFDENTLIYLIGELFRRAGMINDAKLWFSRIIAQQELSPRLKERIHMQVDLMRT